MENIYLAGILPGPSELDVEQLNHVLKPLVDGLLRLWKPGAIFATSGTSQIGILVRCALITLICDLPAMRKAAGFAGHTSSWLCTFCKQRKQDIANLNPETWIMRSKEEYRAQALRFKHAANADTQKFEFTKTGIQWSELLRLPYWDPTKFAVMDSMHNLFLNNIHNHCRYIWNMNESSRPYKNMSPHSKDKQKEWIDAIAAKLRSSKPSAKALKKARRTYLEAFVQLNFVHIVGTKPTKAALIEALIHWVSDALCVTS